MRPKQDKPKALDCTFTAEDMAELSQVGGIMGKARGGNKSERANALKGISQKQHAVLVRWMACSIGGEQIRIVNE